MEKKITKTPNYVYSPGQIRVDFWDPDFDVLIDTKGYDVVWERAIPCPCSRRQGTNLTICKNCLGSGWLFINPKQIKAVTQSINKSTRFKEWSLELLGTASFTVRSDYHLNFMDKITLLNSSSPQSEVLIVRRMGEDLFTNTIYPIQSISEIFKFITPDKPLELLPEGSYTIKDNYIVFDRNVVREEDSLSITYIHRVQYNILDLNHDVRNTIVLDNKSQEKGISLPVSAIGRRVHNVIDAQNITRDNIFDNSYYK